MDIGKYEQVQDVVRRAAIEWGVEVDVLPVPDVGEDVPYGVVGHDESKTPDRMCSTSIMNGLARCGMRVVSVENGDVYFGDPTCAP